MPKKTIQKKNYHELSLLQAVINIRICAEYNMTKKRFNVQIKQIYENPVHNLLTLHHTSFIPPKTTLQTAQMLANIQFTQL
jgi:hypothetical protein